MHRPDALHGAGGVRAVDQRGDEVPGEDLPDLGSPVVGAAHEEEPVGAEGDAHHGPRVPARLFLERRHTSIQESSVCQKQHSLMNSSSKFSTE